MKKIVIGAVAVLGLGACCATAGERAGPDKPSLTRALQQELGSMPGREVIQDRVYLPADSTIPKHSHPGEEIVYVIEGECGLWIEGQGERPLKAGDAAVIPAGAVHTAITHDASCSALATRLHVSGQPERSLAQ